MVGQHGEKWLGNLFLCKKDWEPKTLHLHNKQKMRTVPLDVAPERRTKRCSPRFRPGGRFWGEPRFRYLSPGREGEKCRPLDHTWQIPFIHSVQFVITSNFHIYIKMSRFFLPSGTDTYVLVWWVINNCACAFLKHQAQGWERIFN